MRVFLVAAVLAATLPLAVPLQAQVPKYRAEEGEPALTYQGLVAGRSTLAEVKQTLGEPVYAGNWYNFKLYYPAPGRPEGMVDVFHMQGSNPDSIIGSIEAASIPEGYATEADIRAKLGSPEYELRMTTFRMLDFSEQGLRFTVDAEGRTNGVVYVGHGYRRVPAGERALMDLTHLKSGPQPAPAAPADLQGLQVGVAEVIISPQEQDWLPRPFKVVTDLKSRIAVFRQGELTVALVGNDLFGANYGDVAVLRDAARALGVDHTLFAMSHNHAAGDTIGVYGHYPAEYVKHFQDQTVAGIEEALSKLQPVKELRVAGREMPMDGTRVMHLIRNARNPGVLDPNISVIVAIGMDDTPLTTIIHVACHTESLEAQGEIGADFPGYLCDQVAADGGGQAVYLNGALGGMVSGDNLARTQESSRDMGMQLAAIVNDLRAQAQPVERFKFAAEAHMLEIPVTNPGFKALMNSPRRPVRKGRMLTEMTYVELGTAQLVSLPGELFPEVSFEILERMQGFPRMLIGLCNDQIGYIVPPYDFRDDYYEETMSPGPASAPQVRDMALRLIQAHQNN